jgi:hypothetical protein
MNSDSGFRPVSNAVASRSVGVFLRNLMRRTLLSAFLLSTLLLALSTAVADAAEARFRIVSLANSTAAPGAKLNYNLLLTNVGDADADGTGGDPIVLSVVLPPGITAQSLMFFGTSDVANFGWNCSGDGDSGGIVGASVLSCIIPDVLAADGSLLVVHSVSAMPTLGVNVAPGASGTQTASFQLSGGGTAGPVSTVDPTLVTGVAPVFGIDAFDGQVTADASDAPLTAAGGHPYAASTAIDFNTRANAAPIIGDLWPVEPTKDVAVDLPPGFIGNPTGVDQCTDGQLANSVSTGARPLCVATSQVGTVLVRLNSGSPPLTQRVLGPLPLFNMVPPPNVPARFGFNALGNVVTLDARVRSDGDYGISVDSKNISEGIPIAGTSLSLWGVPSDPSHDSDRACPGHLAPIDGGGSCVSGAPRRAFLRNPTACTPAGGGLVTALHVDSWFNPGRRTVAGTPDLTDVRWKNASFTTHAMPAFPAAPAGWGPVLGVTDCDKVPFSPTLVGAPTGGAKAGAPAGFAFDVTLPQSDDPAAIGEADLKKAVVTLPVGMQVSPSSASGLQACTPSEIGLHTLGDPSCPDGSKVGSADIDTPLLKEQLHGSIYLATPHDNPFNALVAIYLVANGPGVIIKLPGSVSLDQSNGRIVTTFDNNPQTPFSKLHLQFDSGPRAPLVAPKSCAPQTISAVLTSWSGKTVSSLSSFTPSGDGKGGACPGPRFSPGFNAGTVNPVVGAFTPFTLQLQRSDEDQEFQSLRSLSLPPGLLADVGSVSIRCTEVQARAAACPSASHIGTVLAGAGAGPDPFYVPGDVYLMGGFGSGPFKGDPFGLAVVVHAQAGPFDLGYVVVETGIQVHDDGSISAQTEPFPTILQGIPLQLKDIRLNLDRPNFILNPTNCSQMAVAGSVVSTEGMTAPVSSRFQVGECAALGFKPSFTVSTAGKTSKAGGASLHVHLATHEGPSSTGAAKESNIAKVDVQLPVVLPARLPTLQKACTATQFAANPAGCPVGSFVGTAIAHTPILASPLSGPAILVSHGGQAFPDLVLVLQGEGVRLNLTGHTQIKKGITYNHFETVPDAPVSSFDLTLPQGPHAVLTTDIPGRNLCATTRTVTVTKRVTRRINGRARKVRVKAKKAVAAPLLMPTTITAQNGAVIHQNTKIAVTGCAKVKAKANKATTKKGAKISRLWRAG